MGGRTVRGNFSQSQFNLLARSEKIQPFSRPVLHLPAPCRLPTWHAPSQPAQRSNHIGHRRKTYQLESTFWPIKRATFWPGAINGKQRRKQGYFLIFIRRSPARARICPLSLRNRTAIASSSRRRLTIRSGKLRRISTSSPGRSAQAGEWF